MRPFKYLLLLVGAFLLFNACSKDEASLSEEEQLEQEQFNLSARLTAKKLYEDYYLSSKSTSADIAWTGSEASCDSGDVPQAYYRQNFYALSLL